MFNRFLLAGEFLPDRKLSITSNLCQAAEKKIKQDLQNRGSKMVCESLQVRLQDMILRWTKKTDLHKLAPCKYVAKM